MAKKQPRFKTETQEAEWWAKNQNLIADRLQQAKAAGKLGMGTVARVARERTSQAERTRVRDSSSNHDRSTFNLSLTAAYGRARRRIATPAI